MNGRPPHSYDREGDLSHYRSVFEAIERRVIPEVVVTRITPYLLVLVSAAVLGRYFLAASPSQLITKSAT